MLMLRNALHQVIHTDVQSFYFGHFAPPPAILTPFWPSPSPLPILNTPPTPPPASHFKESSKRKIKIYKPWILMRLDLNKSLRPYYLCESKQISANILEKLVPHPTPSTVFDFSEHLMWTLLSRFPSQFYSSREHEHEIDFSGILNIERLQNKLRNF